MVADPLSPVWVHVTLWLVPATQVSPPFGEVTVIGDGGRAMEKFASERSKGAPNIPSATLIRQVPLATSGTVIVSEPSLAVLSARVVQFVPEFVDSWISTVLMLPVLIQVTVALSPAVQLSPPFGAVTVIVLMATSNEIVSP